MQIVTILWSFCATVALTLATACGLVWLIERRRLAMLMLCILGAATAVSAFIELGMLYSATPAEYGAWLRWYHLPLFLGAVAQVLFVHYHLETSRLWLLQSFVFARAVVLVVNFMVQPNFNFAEIVSLRQISLFGDQVSIVGVGVQRDWQLFAIASLFLLLAYLIDAAVQSWRRGDAVSRRKGLAVAMGIVLPWLGAIVYTQLGMFGAIQVPLSNVPWFLGALLITTYELAREFVQSRRAQAEMAGLRDQLAQADRAGILGQLATALAHELTQPLNAISINLAAARQRLGDAGSHADELRAILDSVGRDDRRATDIIVRMRKLLKRRPIELQSLKVEDVVQDAVALVRAETNAKHVQLSVLLQPGLPRVLGDRVHVSQVLLNLLMNAIQALESLPPDARRIVVEARAGEAKDEIEIAVQDTGPGVPDAVVEEIFRPFFTTKPQGTGIGLALSRSIIEAHGGRLWLERAAAQRGALFRLTLKRDMAHASHAEADGTKDVELRGEDDEPEQKIASAAQRTPPTISP